MNEQIPVLLKQLVFLSDEVRQDVLANYQAFSPEKTQQVISFLKNAIAEQQQITQSEAEKNPNIISEAKREVSAEQIEAIHKAEAAQQSSEDAALADLEAELANLL